MLTFLRKIRRSLIESGNARKYLLYAIGEIALVVVGILIALQINNWNEARIARLEVDIIKQNLYNEFVQNRVVLKDRIDLLTNSIHYCQAVMEFMGSDKDLIEATNLDSILVQTLYYGNFNPSNSAIVELIQTGGLKLISDDTLKTRLFNWLELLEDTDEDFKNQDLNANQYLAQYLTKRTSQRNLDLEGIYGVTNNKSSLIKDYYYEVFHDHEFENLMVLNLVWHTIMINHYKDLDRLAAEIMGQL